MVKYVERITRQGQHSWVYKLYNYLVYNNIETMWLKNINKIKYAVGYMYCNDKGFQGEQFVEKWFIDRWAFEVDRMSSLKIYHGKRNNKKEAYINGSEGAKWFFSVISGTAIRNLGDSVDLLSAAERRGTPVLLSASVSDNFGNSPQIAAPRRSCEIDQSMQRFYVGWFHVGWQRILDQSQNAWFVAHSVLPSLERYQYLYKPGQSLGEGFLHQESAVGRVVLIIISVFCVNIIISWMHST